MITLYYADSRGSAKNCLYPHRIDVSDEEGLSQAVSHDYVCAEYKGNYRSADNFIRSNCLAFDVDNDHSDDPDDWYTPDDLRRDFPGVETAIHFSRNHMKEKNGKAPRPKFHFLFAIAEETDPARYEAMKRLVLQLCPYIDAQALDIARLFFGTEKPDAEYYPSGLLNDILPEMDGFPCGEYGAGLSGDDIAPQDDILRRVNKENREMDGDVCSSHVIPQGQRNTTMYSFAVRVLKRFGDTDKASALFLAESDCCSPPLESEELAVIWNSALKFYRKKIVKDPSYVSPEKYEDDFANLSLKPPDYSDLGQAKVLARECGGELCFTEATDYLRYDGKRWNESRQQALGCAEGFLDAQLADARDELISATQALMELGEKADVIAPGKKYTDKLLASGNEKMAEAGRRFAGAVKYKEFVMQRRDMRFIKSAMDAAKPMVQKNISDLDKNEFLLNTPEGTYDLRNGLSGAREHDPTDYITKITAVSPSEKGKRLWEDALQIFFQGDDDLIRYVQQTVGLAAIGKVYQEAIIIAYGDGRNGKSTFWNTVARVFGSYAGNMSADTLTVGCKRNVKPEMAELKGKRLVIAAELEEGMRLNTAMVKQLCSTDDIFAEKKYKDPFSFTPSHTLVLYTNHLPRVGASDAGTWRRLIVIPFNAKIEGKSDIRNYSDYLFREAGEYILRWIIEGAEQVIRNGYEIRLPGCVRKAIQAYRDSNDWFSNFLDDCCEIDPDYKQKSGELYIEYRTYCARNGEYTRSTSDFYTALELAGFMKHKTNKGIFVNGLRLKEDLQLMA